MHYETGHSHYEEKKKKKEHLWNMVVFLQQALRELLLTTKKKNWKLAHAIVVLGGNIIHLYQALWK